jgi:polyisoprenoid-binding protein YceI
MKTLLSILDMIGIASAGSLKIDNGSSWLKVACKATGHSWTAQLKKFTVSASGDEVTLTPSAVAFSWNFANLDSNEADRDAKMLTWLKNPSGSWKMTSQWKDSNGQQYVKGPITIAGVSKEITIPVVVNQSGKTTTIDGEVWLDTSDHSLPTVKMLVMSVNPKMRVNFHLEGSL